MPLMAGPPTARGLRLPTFVGLLPLLLLEVADAQDNGTQAADDCLPVLGARIDPGADDAFRGWYDVQGCGFCHDYCRWVGGFSGGNPGVRLEYSSSWWSCHLAGGDSAYTGRSYFPAFPYARCAGEGAEAPKAVEGVAIEDPSLSEDRSPGAVHWAIAILLLTCLASGFVHVGRALRKVDVVGIAMRSVPEGMRTAQCGSCNGLQYISVHGRVFVCCWCLSANRVPRLASQSEQLVLVANTGPLHGYQFKKGGANYWQELRKEELPELPDVGSNVEAEKLHYRDTYCWGCAQEKCQRLDEIPQGAAVAHLEPAPQADEIQPTVIGNQVSHVDETASNCSTQTYQGIAQCVVCLDGPGRMVLLPCQHGSVCEECATRIAQNRASGGANCPHCRASIERLVKITQVTGDLARGVEVRIPIARTSAPGSAAASPTAASGGGSAPASPTSASVVVPAAGDQAADAADTVPTPPRSPTPEHGAVATGAVRTT